MYTGNVWGIALLIAGFLATLVAFQLLLAALMPARSAAAVRTLRERPIVAGLVGAPAVGFVVAVALVLGQLGGPGKFASALTLAGASFAFVAGLAAVSRLVGERMPSPCDASAPWRATLRGGVTCALAFTVPFAGWFLVLPGSVVMGTGAVIASAFSASNAPAAPAPSAAALSA